jgi:ketosteroid isomerase-like protein
MRTPPEQALRETMSELQAAVEARDAASVHELLADDFIGPEGLDRDGAHRLAQGMFLRYRGIGATIGPLEIVLRDQHAQVRFDAVVTGGSGGLLPESGQAYEVETGWRVEGGEWRLVNAQWRPKL